MSPAKHILGRSDSSRSTSCSQAASDKVGLNAKPSIIGVSREPAPALAWAGFGRRASRAPRGGLQASALLLIEAS